MHDSIEKLGVRLIFVLTVMLTLTVFIAGIVIYRLSDDAVKKRISGYAKEAAKRVNLELGNQSSLEGIKNTLLDLQSQVNGSMWIIDGAGEMVLSLDPSYNSKKLFGDEGITVLEVATDKRDIQTLDRKTMVSSLKLKEIFSKGYGDGFGIYNPIGLGKKVVAFHVLKDKNWLIGVDVPSSAAYSERENLKLNILKLCVLIFIVTMIFTSIAVKKLVKPYYFEQEALRKSVEVNNDKLKQLYEMNNAMQQKLSSGDSDNLISESLLELLQIDRINLFLVSKDKSCLICNTLKEDISKEKIQLQIPLSKDGGVIAKSFREKNIITYDTTEQELPADLKLSEELVQGTDLLSGVFVILPLIVQNKCIGIAIADNHLSRKKITMETVDFLKIVMSQVAVVIENIDLYQRLKKYTQELETTDYLTQVSNFVTFKDMLDRSIHENVENNAIFTLCILHISNFSVYNEKNGHRAGDLVLKKVASILSDNTDENDIVGRCYGAEFGIIFKDKDEKVSLDAVNKIVAEINNTPFKALDILDENALLIQTSIQTYNAHEELTCDEFFKKVEDAV